MPKGGKHRFTLKQDRLAKDIAKEYEKKGYSKKRAKQIGYSTINKIKSRWINLEQEVTYTCLNCGHQTHSGKEMDEHMKTHTTEKSHGRIKYIRDR